MNKADISKGDKLKVIADASNDKVTSTLIGATVKVVKINVKTVECVVLANNGILGTGLIGHNVYFTFAELAKS